MEKEKAAAIRLREAKKTGIPCFPVRDLIGETFLEAAYRVQLLNTQWHLEKGAKIVGKKIGLTSYKVQEQLGVDQPDFGILFDFMEVSNGGVLSYDETMQPKAEAEIAFVLKKDITSLNPKLSEIEDAIDYAVAAIEVVGSRIKDWDIKITDTIADNASASHFVLGGTQKKIPEINVVGSEMKMYLNGELVSTGSGTACIGSPLIAVQWLAGRMASVGAPLEAGDIILSGALGPMVNCRQGDEVVAFIEGLGEVSLSFSD